MHFRYPGRLYVNRAWPGATYAIQGAHMERTLIAGTLFVMVLTGCSRQVAADHRQADAQALRDGEVAAFVKDWGGKDARLVAKHFATSGHVIVPNAPVMTGPKEIAATMSGAFSDPHWSMALQPVQVEVSLGSDMGYVRGAYLLTATDPASNKVATEKGRFLVVFQREADGLWKATQHISNAEAPAVLR